LVHNGVSLQQMYRDSMYMMGRGVGIGDMYARAFTSANSYNCTIFVPNF